MQYEKPEWEVIEFEKNSIVTASPIVGETGGEGGSEDDGYFD